MLVQGFYYCWLANVYAIKSDLELIYNFSYFLGNPINGDQHQQIDDRIIIDGVTLRQQDAELFNTDVTHKIDGEFSQTSFSLNDALFSLKAGANYFGFDNKWSLDVESLGLVYAINKCRAEN